jgi:hypothetical protein
MMVDRFGTPWMINAGMGHLRSRPPGDFRSCQPEDHR